MNKKERDEDVGECCLFDGVDKCVGRANPCELCLGMIVRVRTVRDIFEIMQLSDDKGVPVIILAKLVKRLINEDQQTCQLISLLAAKRSLIVGKRWAMWKIRRISDGCRSMLITTFLPERLMGSVQIFNCYDQYDQY